MSISIFNKLKWWLFPFWFVWCFPSFLLGSVVYAYSKFVRKSCVRCKSPEGIVWYMTDNRSPVYGVSIFPFVFLSEKCADSISVRHEFGHCVQCLIWGWLYLIVIGIPSLTSNIPKVNKLLRGRSYNSEFQYYGLVGGFDFWWERDADRKGGIEHLLGHRVLRSDDVIA